MGWMPKVLASVASMQATDSQSMALKLAKRLGGTPAVSAHPTSGRRSQPDEMLGIVAVVGAIGGFPSTWAGPSLDWTVRQFQAGDNVFRAIGDERALTAEFPFADRTSLLQVRTDVGHPSIGNGLAIRSSLPIDGVDGAWAAEMNRQELCSTARTHFLGSWVASGDAPGFTAFYSNMVGMALDGDASNLVFACVGRHRWAAESLAGDDWAA